MGMVRPRRKGVQDARNERSSLLAEATKGRPTIITRHGRAIAVVVNLLLPLGGKLIAVEIKLTATPTAGHTEPLERFKALAGKRAAREGVLVCRVPAARPLPGGNVALPWHEFPRWLDGRLG